MASMFQPSTSTAPHDAPVIESASHWLDDDQDLMLGCECANPALQIERWGQEAAPAMSLAA